VTNIQFDMNSLSQINSRSELARVVTWLSKGTVSSILSNLSNLLRDNMKKNIFVNHVKQIVIALRCDICMLKVDMIGHCVMGIFIPKKVGEKIKIKNEFDDLLSRFVTIHPPHGCQQPP